MKKLTKNYKKMLAAVMTAALIAPTILTGAGVFGTDPPGIRQAGENEFMATSSISNLTGVKSEKILGMREEGMSWNEILDRLKGGGLMDAAAEEMDELLAGEGLEEDAVGTLLDMGYTRDEITGAKLIVERVLFNLEEITAFDEEKEYSDLKSQIDIDRAIYYMLALKDEFGDMQKVLDEYLLTLQTGLNLETYIEDAKEYEEEKSKMAADANTQAITCRMIEEKMLETVQSRVYPNNENKFVNEEAADGIAFNENEVPEIRPELPETEDVRPVNPAQKLKDQIDAINPMMDR